MHVDVDQTYPGYRGDRRWSVTHKTLGTAYVAAKDETSALAAAAAFWKVRWQSWDFYTMCIVLPSK